jgi:DNA uptake protein ComE-like DNA-binding protein
MKSKYTIIILSVIIFCSISFIVLNKPPISEATAQEIQTINGIGEVLSERVVSYLDANPNADIEDLEAVKGIGPEKVKLLRKEFK